MNRHTQKFCGLLFATTGLAVTIGACSAPPTFDQLKCDPKIASLADPWCLEQTADAGTDAESDDGIDASNGQNPEDPGLDSSSWVPPDICKTGHCLPTPVGEEAGLWEAVPISLWIGPIDQIPAKCPDDPVYGVPNETFRRYAQLVAPPAICSACTCGPSEGTCSGVPDTLELRAGACAQNGVVTTPFDAPTNWDGSCTTADTIAAGAKCPAGSQTLCVQSVHSSALPSPINDSCTPSISAPSSTLETSWEIAALGCDANTEAQSCGTDTLTAYCVNYAGPEWLQCTYREGVHEKCPDNYQYARHVLYPEEPIDNRGCSACECGAPMASACVGGLRLSTGSSCGTDLVCVARL